MIFKIQTALLALVKLYYVGLKKLLIVFETEEIFPILKATFPKNFLIVYFFNFHGNSPIKLLHTHTIPHS